MRMVVVLPAPSGLITPRHSPGAMLKRHAIDHRRGTVALAQALHLQQRGEGGGALLMAFIVMCLSQVLS